MKRCIKLVALSVVLCSTDSVFSKELAIPQPIVESLERNDRARVIVRLNAPFSTEPELQKRPEAQRRRIGEVREALLRQLVGTDHRVSRSYRIIPYVALEIDVHALSRIRQSPLVLGVEHDAVVEPFLSKSTSQIGATNAWSQGLDGSGTYVAILDTGVETTHELFSGKQIIEACFVSNNGCPNGQSSMMGPGSAVPCSSPACFHGTHVAGIAVGAEGDADNDGVAETNGVAPGADLVAIQVFGDSDGDGVLEALTSDFVAGLEYVSTLVQSGVPVVAANLSIGGDEKQYPAECDIINTAATTALLLLDAQRVATVVATGNEEWKAGISFPACISWAVKVGASSHDSSGFGFSAGNCVSTTFSGEEVACFSNSAPFVDLLAPGGAKQSCGNTVQDVIRSSVTANGYGCSQGTSMAAPHVAGAWAVLRQLDPGASVQEVLSMLQSTGRGLRDPGNGVILPRIRVDEALTAPTDVQWVDYDSPLCAPFGTFHCPWPVIATAVVEIGNGGTILVKAGSSPETLTLTKPLTLRAFGGEVRIGQPAKTIE